MSVAFRPRRPYPAAAPTDLWEEEIYENGDYIEEALILTEHLPRGFPTEPFDPFLVQGTYAIRVDIQVAQGKIVLIARQPPPQEPQHAIPYVVFARNGLPLTIPFLTRQGGSVDVPGSLHPLALH